MGAVVRRRATVTQWVLGGRGPLTRGTDRIEVLVRLLVLVAVLGATPVAVLTGRAVHQHATALAAEQARDRHEVRGVVLVDPPAVTSDTTDTLVQTTVGWTGVDGTQETADAPVPVAARVDDPVTLWLTDDGRLTTPPLDRERVLGRAVWAGTLAALGLVAGAWALLVLARRALDARRSRQWELEWSAVERLWASRER